jgi:hypothetical protein
MVYRILVVTIFSFLLLGRVTAQSKKEQIEALKRRLDSLQEVNSAQVSLINQNSLNISELNDNLIKANKDLKELRSQLQDRTSEINLQKAEIKKLESEIKAKTDSISFLVWEKPDMLSLDTIRYASGDLRAFIPGSLDEVLFYQGVYQSADSYELYMPRFTDSKGPRVEIEISAWNDFAFHCNGDYEYKYYAHIKYCEDIVGQFEANNEKEIYTEIVQFQKEGELVKMTLQASSCNGGYSMTPEEKQEQKMLSSNFVLVMKFLANGKVLISTENAPKLCNHDWGFDNVTFYPLVWSR